MHRFTRAHALPALASTAPSRSRGWAVVVAPILALLLVLPAAPAAAAGERGRAIQRAPRRAAPKTLTVNQAARYAGHRVYVATGSAAPLELLDAMRQHSVTRAKPTKVYYMATMAGAEHFAPEVTAKWRPNLFFISGSNREAATEGRAELHRASLYQLGRRIDKGEFNFDTVVVRVSPPDKQGYVSLGTTGDLTLSAVRQVLARGGKIIAEENPFVPNTAGNRIKYSDLSYVVKNERMLTEYVGIWPMPQELAIAKNVAKLVPNRRRATLQVGIGNAVAGLGQTLQNKRLGIWSEMGTDSWVLPLMSGDKPAVRGTAKFSFLHGTSALYDFANNNPRIAMGPSTEINDPKKFAAMKRPVAVNTALEVDIFGNVNAERVTLPDGKVKIISAPGGQPDFMKAASMAPQGRAVMALRSTAKEGAVSAIVPKLSGPVVTTPKKHVDHVVTEWGATKKLRRLSDAERAYEIIRVSAPTFRAELARQALDKGIITKSAHDKLRRSIFHSLLRADAEVRGELHVQALQQQLITQAQHDQIAQAGQAAQQAN